MGGSAFSYLANPPYTPRMPPAVYKQVKAAYHAALRELFVHVTTPIEGPAKKDHGDIDILVAGERRLFFPKTAGDSIPKSPSDLLNEVKLLLNAEFCKITGSSANLAIRRPSCPSDQDNGNEDEKEKFIQVDVRICKDVDQLCWGLFKHAHGDIWNLLGSTIRPFGLTVDEDALWIRIPEIENDDRKRAKVELTRDPVEIMHFLGMKVEGFWTEPFDSVEALFDYVTTCRLFWVSKEGSTQEAGENAGSIGGEEGKKKLKSNDRKRMAYRAVFRRWIDEFIPKLRAEGRFGRPHGTSSKIKELRAMVRDEAFATFFVGPEYNARVKAWRLQRNENEVKRLIKEFVPSEGDDKRDPNQYRSILVSAMKKIILENDHNFEAVVRPQFKDAEGFYDLDVVREFTVNSQKQVGEIAWGIQTARYLESRERKELKRKIEDEAAGTSEERNIAVLC
ncbi:hypothetical protein QBC43DRAFT_315273 [Cladorrhinum sp. PSN259]|nr:hypothetical protein QBC43DRAFT_315273 [Cladorrhinum sp. PSN259]